MTEDPHEKTDLADEGQYADIIAIMKGKLIKELEGREEGFVKDGELVLVNETKTTLDFLKE